MAQISKKSLKISMMKETYFDFKKLDLNPRIISAAKQNGLLSSEGVLYGCSRHCQAGRQLPHADQRQLVAAVAALYCPARLTAQEMLQKEKDSTSFGCPVLDRAVGAVLRRGTVLEVCGESAAGKTQLALTLAVHTATPQNLGGKGAKVAYVCTEGRFPSSRLCQMTEAAKKRYPSLRHDEIASNILVQHIDDLQSLVACVEHQLPAAVSRHGVAVVIVDSVAAPVRAADLRLWTDRQAALRRLGSALRRLAAESSCLVVALNQVCARMGEREDLYGLGEAGDVLPALGLSWSNLVTTRLLLRRGAPAAPLPGEDPTSPFLGSTPGSTVFSQEKGSALCSTTPAPARCLQVLSCPWMPRLTVFFEVQKEGIRGIS